ncbi:MAG: MBL fold metallo-hydrolase [bacterium]|nr:MBL fold metallo-hydrolase [bacterium]
MKKEQFINYTYIIVDKTTNFAAIIDPSWELEILVKKIEALNLSNFIVLLTHSHIDHVNLVESLSKLYSPRIFISKIESDYYNYTSSNLEFFNHLDRIILGDTRITTLITPGHTAGSTCFLLDHDIFTGDTIFIEGCGICDCEGGSPIDMYNSIQFIKNNMDHRINVYPSHSYAKEPGEPLEYLVKYNIYFQFKDLETFTGYRMRELPGSTFDFK